MHESSTLKPAHPPKKGFELWQKILFALILGVIIGLCFGKDTLTYLQSEALHNPNSLIQFLLQLHPYGVKFVAFIKPVGDIFVNAIKMIVVPIVFISIVCGMVSITNPKTMGRMGIKTLGIFIATMALASVVGLLFAHFTQPGSDILQEEMQVSAVTQTVDANGTHHKQSVADLITNLVPSNPVQAMATANILQVVVFAFVFGIALVLAGEAGKPVSEFFISLAAVVQHIPRMVMRFAPYGVFALMVNVSAHFGLAIIGDLLLSVGTIYAACISFALIFYSLILRVYAGLSPIPFFKGITEAMSFAYSTTSSAATLPYTSHCTEKNLGVPKQISNFVLPLATAVNLNGLSIYLSVVAVFAANLFGIELTLGQYIMIVLTGSLGSMGASGVPGSGLMVMAMVLGAIGLNAEGVAIVIAMFAGVDRMIDMMTTTVNVTGDAFVSVIVAKSENVLDTKIYNQPEVVHFSQEKTGNI